MVHIINGEIVADDDPRVKAKFQSQSGPAQRRPAAGGGAAPNGAPPPGAPTPSPLVGLARGVGLEGTVTIPAISFLGLPARPVEKIYLAVSAVLVYLFGWRALAFLAFAYFVSLQAPATAAPVAGAAPPRHGGPGGPTGRAPGSNVRTL
jgi:hypothetical protein